MSRIVGFLIYEGLQTLDLAGPLDAFGAANESAGDGPPPYSMVTARTEDGSYRVIAELAAAD